MRKFLLSNLKIVDGKRIIRGGLLIFKGKIAAILPLGCCCEDALQIDCRGLYASAGFIDSHTHGAGGADFMDGTVQAYKTACHTHLCHGTTTLLPTLLTGTLDEILRSIMCFRIAQQELSDEMFLPGLHLEGPYFSLAQRGAQDPTYIHNPDPAEYNMLLNRAGDVIRRWSIAPELPGALALGDKLAERGILASIAHTDATYQDCVNALSHGYRHVTHLYSGMSSIRRQGGFRIAGVVESTYVLDDLTAELIADGCHLPPELIAMAVKCKGVDRLCLVTDSLRPAGQNVKESLLGSLQNGQKCIIEDGVAKMPDRSGFCGSVALADRLVRTAWKQAKLPLEDVICMMCETPAKILGIENHKGRLLPGKDADVVLFDEDVHIHAVYYMGRQVCLND